MSSSTAPAAFWKRRGFLSVVAGFLLIAGAAAAFLMIDPQNGGAPRMDFAQRQKVSVDSKLHFSFPEYMDQASVQESLSSAEKLQGTWEWQNDVLVFTPSQPLTSGANYTFSLPRTARTADGEALGRDLDFVFTVAGAPKIVAQIPGPDATRIDAKSKITIVFDRAMIPLAQVQGETTKDTLSPWPVTIDPPVAGRWRWMSTVAREFIPEKAFVAGTKYTVTVPKGIPAVAGDQTDKDYVWSFETLRPEIMSSTPASEDRFAGPSTVLSLQFNREVDAAGAAQFLTLLRRDPAKDEIVTSSGGIVEMPKGEKMAIKEVIYGTKTENEKRVTDKTVLVVVPRDPLAYKTLYALYAAPGIKGLEGNLGTASPFLLRFATVGDLTASEGGYVDFNLNVKFSNPMDPESLKNITIVPSPLNASEMTWSVYDWTNNTQAVAHPQLKPSTPYTVTAGKGVKDIYGQTIREPFTFTFTTQPLAPEVYIHSKGEFGIFEKGKPPIYYLNGVNVSKLEVKFAKLTLADFLRLRKSEVDTYGVPAELSTVPDVRSLDLPSTGKKDEWFINALDVSKAFGPQLGAGIYGMTLTAPEAVDQYSKIKQVQEQYFGITNLSVTLKYSGAKALVWVTDMTTGEPVNAARITFHTLNGTTPVRGATDAKGFFEAPINIKDFNTGGNNAWEPEFWVTAETADDFAFVGSRWNDGIRPYNFDLNGDFRNPMSGDYRLDSYVYTERPLYKAGDTVNLKGIVRLRDWNGDFSMPAGKQAVVKVQDAEGNQVFDKALAIGEFGSFNASFPLDVKASLGTYYVSVQLTPETGIDNNYAGASFSVLAYRKPEYKIDIVPETEEYFSGDTVKAQVKGSYYFGAPMGGAKVSWRAQTTDYFFNKYTDGWYSFSVNDQWCWYDCERATEVIAQGEGALDAAGNLNVSVPVTLKENQSSQVLSIEADVTDANNQVVSNRSSVYVHAADAYAGIKSEDYVVTPGSPAKMAVITLKPDGSVLPNKAVSVRLYSRTWNTIKKKGVDGEYYYDNEPQDTFIRETSVTTDQGGKAVASLLIGTGGEYRVIVSVKDTKGREMRSATSVYAWSSSYVNWPRTNSDRMEVIADKPEYKVGETATLLMKSPFQGKGVKALVTVEREGVMTKQVIDVVSNAQSIEIPVTEQMIPNAYVSVVVVKPRIGETFDDNGVDTGAPAFKIGYVKLNVDTFSKRLDVALSTDKKQYLPGEKVTVTFKTTDAFGKPVPAELSLGVVDMSLLALSSFQTPDLTKLFYSERGLGVNTSQMLMFLLERFKPGSKGGGGGEDGETKTRGNFKDTAFWLPNVVTNAQGDATATFALPDNLTTWQLLAVGSTKTHGFGSVAETVLETKNVIIRPVRPRFAVRGDSVTLGAIVHNFLPDSKVFTVSLAGEGFDNAIAKTQTVTLKPGEQRKLNFSVKVNDVNTLKLRFSAFTEGAKDEIEESIPVFTFGSPQTVATTGITETVAMEKVLVPSAKDARSGVVDISVSPSMAAFLPSGLEYLATYPYGCTEQTLSAFVPGLALSRLQGFEQLQFVNRGDLEKKLTAGLQRIYAFQHGDGGFGYWEGGESYPYLSAYVLFSLNLSRQAGFSVDENVIARTNDYLNGVLRVQNQKDKIDLATRAYILYVLAEAGTADPNLLSNLYEQRNALPLFSRAHLAMAYQNEGNAGRARDILSEMVNAAKVDSRGTHFEEAEEREYGYLMNTNQRTTALVLQAMVRIDPDNALMPNVIRYLLSARENGHWDTTQSTVHVLLAFADYLQFTDELSASYAAGVEVNGKKQLDWNVTSKDVLQRKQVTLALDELARGAETEVKIGKEGTGRLYYDIQMSYFFTGDVIQPAEEGMAISRSLKPLKGSAADYKVGETYLMTLQMTVPEGRNFVAVESPLPAGMELVDVTLNTSQQNLLAGLSDRPDMWSWQAWESGVNRFTHMENRDDRLFLFADYLPAGVYEYRAIVRATTPGTYRYRPATMYEMYFPEVFGQTDGGWLTIKE